MPIQGPPAPTLQENSCAVLIEEPDIAIVLNGISAISIVAGSSPALQNHSLKQSTG
jgi:hypothetical protein